jgi:hypothetical protein
VADRSRVGDEIDLDGSYAAAFHLKHGIAALLVEE